MQKCGTKSNKDSTWEKTQKCSEESMQWLTVYVLIQNMPESLGIGLRGCMSMEKNRWDMR